MSFKAQFHCPQAPYFLSHSVGLQPKTSDQALRDGFLAGWRDGRADVWNDWLGTIELFRRRIATLINASSNEVCPQTNISSALTKLIFSLPREEKRRRIVLTQEDFPTIGFVLKQAERMGYSLHFLETGPALADPATWQAALDDDVCFVHITHVFSNLGLKTPVKEITAAADAAGVYSIVDAAQSAGALPLDVQDWSASAVLGTGVKYLCGGPGAAWVWVDPAVTAKAEPIDVGWFSHEEPFGFDIDDFRYAEDATRFMGGTPSPAPYALAAAGVEAILNAGVSNIAEHTQSLIERFLAEWPEPKVLSHRQAGERGAG